MSQKRLPRGEVVGNRYQIERVLGQGGSGVVYAARQLDLPREVVIKTVIPNTDDPIAHQRFRREAALTASIDHPNIVKIYELGTHGKMYFIAMERLRGRTLNYIIRDTPGGLPANRVERILAGILEGLAAAHAGGVLHRDLKPGNVFVCDMPGRPDFVKLIDFGIAKATTGQMEVDTTLTQRGFVVGTPGYLAPEVLAGTDTSAAADLYSAGIIAWEMLTGKRCYKAKTALAVMSLQMHNDPEEPAPYVTMLPVWNIIQRLFERDPLVRYTQAGDALEDIRSVLAQGAANHMAAGTLDFGGEMPASPTVADGSIGAIGAMASMFSAPPAEEFPASQTVVNTGASAMADAFAPFPSESTVANSSSASMAAAMYHTGGTLPDDVGDAFEAEDTNVQSGAAMLDPYANLNEPNSDISTGLMAAAAPTTGTLAGPSSDSTIPMDNRQLSKLVAENRGAFEALKREPAPTKPRAPDRGGWGTEPKRPSSNPQQPAAQHSAPRQQPHQPASAPAPPPGARPISSQAVRAHAPQPPAQSAPRPPAQSAPMPANASLGQPDPMRPTGIPEQNRGRHTQVADPNQRPPSAMPNAPAPAKKKKGSGILFWIGLILVAVVGLAAGGGLAFWLLG